MGAAMNSPGGSGNSKATMRAVFMVGVILLPSNRKLDLGIPLLIMACRPDLCVAIAGSTVLQLKIIDDLPQIGGIGGGVVGSFILGLTTVILQLGVAAVFKIPSQVLSTVSVFV